MIIIFKASCWSLLKCVFLLPFSHKLSTRVTFTMVPLPTKYMPPLQEPTHQIFRSTAWIWHHTHFLHQPRRRALAPNKVWSWIPISEIPADTSWTNKRRWMIRLCAVHTETVREREWLSCTTTKQHECQQICEKLQGEGEKMCSFAGFHSLKCFNPPGLCVFLLFFFFACFGLVQCPLSTPILQLYTLWWIYLLICFSLQVPHVGV